MRLPPSKLPNVGTTIFTVMSQLAAQHQAINLGQGFPDFNCSPQLQQLLQEAVQNGHNQYAPMAGLPALRQAVAVKTENLYGHRYDAEREITITAGATQALMTAILALVQPGDEVVVLEPAYDSYLPAVELAGGRAVAVPLNAAQGFAPDWDRVRAAINGRTRLLVLNFPHNPSGRILRAEDLVALEQIVQTTGVLLLSDEVYEHIVFDGQPHRSVSSREALAAHSVVVSSFGKTFHTTGWKVATMCAPAAITAELRKLHQFMVFAVNTPAQYAITAYLANANSYLDLPAFYQAKRDKFIAGLKTTPLKARPCEGTYFVLADYSAVSQETEAQFAQRLITEFGVAAIPLSGLYQQSVDNRLVRFCFAKKDRTLEAGLERLQRLKHA